MATPRILSIGQCGFDHGTLTRFLETEFRAEVAAAETFDEAIDALRSTRYELVLVNRITDADGTSGLDLIRSLKADPSLSGLPVMLVSNIAKAQSEAVALGALPGFGKSELRQPETRRALESAMAARS